MANTRVLAPIRPEANVSFLASRSGKEKGVGEEKGKGKMKDSWGCIEEEETGETQSVITRNVYNKFRINNILPFPLPASNLLDSWRRNDLGCAKTLSAAA